MTDVYLVDDHAMMRDGLRAVLESNGHRIVGESADPTTAVFDIQQLTPNLLILDLQLGERIGLELLSELKRRQLKTRTIVLTMSAQPRHVAEALRLGASGYLLKGASARELMDAIERVLDGHVHLGEGVAKLALEASSTRDETAALTSLSIRERQIIVLVVNGRSSADIAAQLHLSPKTVESYRSRLMAKIGVNDVPALVRFAIRSGLIDPDQP